MTAGLATAVAITMAFAIAPSLVEERLNQVRPHAAYQPGPQAEKLHRRLRVVDLHADTLLWRRDFLQRSARGQVDRPRLVAGNVALQVLTVVTRSPRGLNYRRNAADAPDDITLLALAQRWPPRTWNSLAERALYQAARLDAFAARAPGSLLRVRSRADLEELLARRSRGEGVVGALLGTEGSHALDGRIDNIARLQAAGFRVMGLQHFFDNELGGSLHGVSGAGLSDFGRRAVAEMRRLGIVIDVAHSSPAVVEEVLELGGAPLLLSHTGIYSHCPGPRNIPDALLARIAAGGGLIGIGFWDEAVCDDTPAGVAAAIEAAITLLGPRAVALGSDFDGAITAAFDVSELAALTAALLERGLDESVIAGVMGENAIRFFHDALPRGAAP